MSQQIHFDKLAFVAPWYGRDIPGGAEALTRQTAMRLQQAGFEVEIITTCIRDLHADWGRNYHRPGVTYEDDLLVRRFPVGKRNRRAFDEVNWRLMQGQTISAADEEIFNNEMFNCPDLFAHIRQSRRDYLFFFIPYMFATTYVGAQIAPQRSVIIPCLHDEAYARLQIHRRVIPRVKALVFNAETEKELADRLFPPDDGQIRAVIGAGVDADWRGDGDRFRRKYGLGDTPFVLYAGRREPGKNTPLLLRYWREYVTTRRRDVKLVLLGAGEIGVDSWQQDQIIDLGFVAAQDKYDAYAAASVFCMPSVHESFSIVIMESWLAGTPVLVHADCGVTRESCVKANGGLYFAGYDEFALALDYLLDHPATAITLGQQGRRYVLNHFQWPSIIERYTEVIQSFSGA